MRAVGQDTAKHEALDDALTGMLTVIADDKLQELQRILRRPPHGERPEPVTVDTLTPCRDVPGLTYNGGPVHRDALPGLERLQSTKAGLPCPLLCDGKPAVIVHKADGYALATAAAPAFVPKVGDEGRCTGTWMGLPCVHHEGHTGDHFAWDDSGPDRKPVRWSNPVRPTSDEPGEGAGA